MPQSSKSFVDWTIKNLDSGFLIKPQLPLIDGVKSSSGAELAIQHRHGFQDPVVQWSHGKGTVLNVETMLYARHSGEAEDVINLLDWIEQLSLKDETLGRSPICLFTYGIFLSETVLISNFDKAIKSVDPILGTPREVRLTFSLHKYVPFSQQSLNPTKPQKLSFYLVASAAERSYEALAKRHYGDPMLGDVLRKMHPAEPMTPTVGATIHMPPKSYMLKQSVAPRFHALSLDDPDAVANFEKILADRSARKVVMVR